MSALELDEDIWSANEYTTITYPIDFDKSRIMRTPAISKIPGITGKGDLSGKAHYRALDSSLQRETALAFSFGKAKHGADNFRKMTSEASGEVFDALKRHLEAWVLGETHAIDSKIHHLAHVAANLNMLFRLVNLYGDASVLDVITGGDFSKLKGK